MVRPPREAQRAGLVEVALRLLEESGPEALQARNIAREAGVSTQALYTQFGGMSGLFEELVAEGFRRFARFVDAVPQTDDPVADFFAGGAAYCAWAFAHRELYRLMFGLTGGRLRQYAGLELSLSAAVANTPEGQVALGVMVRSLDRVLDAGRIRPVEPVIVAGQFLSATHGYVTLEIAGMFGDEVQGFAVIGPLATNLIVGLGDDREAAEESLERAFASLGGEQSPR